MTVDHPRISETLIPLDGTRFDYGATSISREEGEFIWSAIRSRGYAKTIEIGCALGVASLYICDAISTANERSHTIIDPFQTAESDGWESIGIRNLEARNFEFFTLIEQPSEIALPKLLESGESFDFGLIDGFHTFDHALVDFFFLNRMIRVGGMIVFDDANWPSVRKLLRYLRKYPAYELVAPREVESGSVRLSLRQHALRMFIGATRLLSDRTRKELFSDRVNAGIVQASAAPSVIGLLKVREDDRRWDWFEDFS